MAIDSSETNMSSGFIITADRKPGQKGGTTQSVGFLFCSTLSQNLIDILYFLSWHKLKFNLD